MAFELRIFDLHTNDGHQAFTDVLAGKALDIVLTCAEQLVFARVIVQHPRECGTEAGYVGTAIAGADDIGERKAVFDKRFVVLEGDLHDDLIDRILHVQDVRVDRTAIAVERPHEALHPTVKKVGDFVERPPVLVPVRLQVNCQALVQIGHFLEAARNRVPAVVDHREYLVVRHP